MKTQIRSLLFVCAAAFVFADCASAQNAMPSDNKKIQTGDAVNSLGMTLVDPTEELMKVYGLPTNSPGPIMVQVRDQSFFPNGYAPTAGCAFWIVEPPAKGFLFNKEKYPSYYPKTVRELAEAILSCTATPEEYQKICSQTAQAAREYAETLTNNPAERERWLKNADRKMLADDVGKYICRVVYNYPGQRGTMTTYIRMTKADLDQIREFTKK
jgi:hypothetical protein